MNKKLIIIGCGLIAILLLWSGVSIYPDWLWFENLGFSPVFWTMLLSKFGFGLMIWVLLILIISLCCPTRPFRQVFKFTPDRFNSDS
jgi:uncharacterized membrane protein (UPF0182 family)